MKVVALLEHEVAGGGGFNQAVNAILQMRRICDSRFEFEVFTTYRSNIDYLARLGVTARLCGFSALDLLIGRLGRYPWWQALQRRLRLTGRFEKQLLLGGCDLVYFVTPSDRPALLQRLNYLLWVWDLCHRDHPEFPEVRDFAEFQARERLFGSWLAPAFGVLADSPELASAIARRYGVDPDRILPMPFAAAATLGADVARKKADVLSKYALEDGYFFYPARLWAHKNHIRILQALKLLGVRGFFPKVVFAGGDAGNRQHIERIVEEANLREQVRFLGFVPAEDMRGLYEGCVAVVMPTYFGPTNLPPLEAWTMGKPLIYSKHCAAQAADAALYVDPDSAEEVAEAMHTCADPETRARLAALGKHRLEEIERERRHAEARLASLLGAFAARRSCWA